MRSKLFLLAMLFILPLQLSASYNNDCCLPEWKDSSECCDSSKWALQIRGAAFLSTNNHVRHYYKDSWPSLQFEGSYRLCDNLLWWANVSWATKTGHNPFFVHTKLNLVPISTGLEWEFNVLPCLDAYVGGGISCNILTAEGKNDHLFPFDKTITRVGGVTKMGLRYSFCECYFLDVFADYYFTQLRHLNGDLLLRRCDNFDGFFVGGGVGMKF